jgi:hypothetical protein
MAWGDKLPDSVKESLVDAQWKLAAYQGQHHWVRTVMDRETRQLVQSIGPQQLNALEISGRTWGRLEQFKTYRSVHYPDFDICADTLPEQFDLILAEQVWEQPAVAVSRREKRVRDAAPRRPFPHHHTVLDPHPRRLVQRLHPLDRDRN